MLPAEISLLRSNLGYTQEEFARALGVSFATVNRWERGHYQPSRLAAAQLEKLLRSFERGEHVDGAETKER